MKKSYILFVTKAIFIMASFVFISCEKSSGSLGLDLVVDGKANLGVKRTIPLVITSEATDSIQTTKPQNVIVGHLDDMFFGTSEASFVTQYILSQTNPDFGANAICDSAKLVILYDGYYGDTNTMIEINVHELNQELYEDTTYYSNDKFLTGSLLGSSMFEPRPTTSPNFEDTLISPSTIVDIDPTWVNNKIILPAIAGDPAFESNDEFVKYFKGIQVSASMMGNCTPYYDVNSSASFLRIYYREDPSDTETEEFNLYAELGLASANLSEFDYTNAEFDLDNQDTINGEAKLYVQSLGGTSARINLDALETYKDSAFIINKAELVFNVTPGSDAINSPPQNLYLLEEKNGVRIFVVDFYEGTGHFGGDLEYNLFKEGKYVFNISRQINKYLNTDNDINDLVLIPANASINMNRVELSGYNSTIQPAEFNLYFTRTKSKN